MINLKKNDAIADAVRGIMEKELVGNQKKLDKNHNGKLDSQDFKILRGQKKATEDVEQIDELKKSTLASYAKKATDDVSYHSFSAGTRPSKDPERLKDDKKAMNRQAGVNKAVDRLAKEDVEQIDELSKSTLISYLNKKKSEYMKGKTQSGSKENAKDIQNMGKAHDKMNKEDVESVEENAFDYKSPRKPEPNGGSGVKQGSRYGGSKQKEKPEQEEPKEKMKEAIEDTLHPAGAALLKHIKPQHHNLYKPHLAKGTFNGSYKDRTDVLNAAKSAGHLKEEIDPSDRTEDTPAGRVKTKQKDDVGPGSDGRSTKVKYHPGPMTLKGMKEKYEEPILDELINEVLSKDASAYDYIHDFVHSDNPKFAGKSKAERKKQALAAYYAKKNEEYVEEGMLKNAAKKAFKALTGGSDEDQRKDLQRKMGVPQTGKKPTKEEAVVESKGPTSQMDEPFVTDAENKPLNNAKELAAKTMKRMKNEMLGKTGTSE
jgi:hypothetical protein